MPRRFSCSRGHQWDHGTDSGTEPLVGEVACPTCGERVPVDRRPEPEQTAADAEVPIAEAGTSPDAPTLPPDAKTPTSPPLGEGQVPVVEAAPFDIPGALQNHPRYRVIRLLGVGGMGAVFLAEHQLMERNVALKVISQNMMQNATAVERFRREVKAAARLHHPNIVTAFDAEQAGDVHFLVMEYVPGISLAHFVAKHGPLPVQQACDYVRQACLGLQHAMDKGMVHRDIKPQNLMVTPEGRLKILDFGLARFASEAVVTADGKSLADSFGGAVRPGASFPGLLTQAGSVMGTPDYIAPEQIDDARKADIRADIYSLGCTFYYLLCGQAPFAAVTALFDKLVAHRERVPLDIRQRRPEVPDGVAAVVHRMIAKRPQDRYATPAAVAGALEPFTGRSAGDSVTIRVRKVPPGQSVTAPSVIPIAETTEVQSQPARKPTPTPSTFPPAPKPARSHARISSVILTCGIVAAMLILVAGLVAAGLVWIGSEVIQEIGPELSQRLDESVIDDALWATIKEWEPLPAETPDSRLFPAQVGSFRLARTDDAQTKAEILPGFDHPARYARYKRGSDEIDVFVFQVPETKKNTFFDDVKKWLKEEQPGTIFHKRRTSPDGELFTFRLRSTGEVGVILYKPACAVCVVTEDRKVPFKFVISYLHATSTSANASKGRQTSEQARLKGKRRSRSVPPRPPAAPWNHSKEHRP